MSQSPANATHPEDLRPVFAYDGKISELFGIFLLNLLLTIVTLGIWRFWAITRIRRYLWSHLRFEGSRLAYTGKGKELFYGFLLGMTILGLIFAAAGLIAAPLAEAHPALAAIPAVAAYLIVMVLFGAAHFSAQRYRLSRTEWRGIRGGVEGSALRYGLAWMLYVAAVVATLYQALPWMQVGLARRRIDASRFGSAALSFDGRVGRLYLVWLGTLLGYLVLLAVAVGLVLAIAWPSFAGLFSGGIEGPRARVLIGRVLPVIVVGVLAFGVAAGLLATWYWACLARLIIGNTSMTTPGAHAAGPVRFSSAVTAGGLLWLFASNALIGLITLGFGLPIVLHRSARYMARTILMRGAFDADALAQSTLAQPRTGEGLLQALDPGVI